MLEILLYIGLASTILLATSSFFILTLQSRVKNQTIAEVEQQGVRVMQIITQKIHNASALTSPSQGVSGANLSLDAGAIIFDISGGVIRIDEGAPVDISSNRLIASDLSFYNLSYTDTPGIVRIQFTLTYDNISGKNEYNYNKTFYGSASLRDI